MSTSDIAGQIKDHMEILCSQGMHVGTVDHLEGSDRIKLTKKDSDDQKHHFIPLSTVDRVDAKVHLNKPCDEIKSLWTTE